MQNESSTSTRHKRKRHAKKPKRNTRMQGALDSLLTAGSVGPQNMPLKSLQDSEEAGTELGGADSSLAEVAPLGSGGGDVVAKQSNVQTYLPVVETKSALDVTQFAQSVNESAPTIPRVPSKFKKDIERKIPKHPEMRMGDQTTSTSLALSRLEGFVHRLSCLNPHDNHPEFEYAQKEVHKARVDYNYCLYYPGDKEWRPPPSADKRDMSKAKSLPKPKQWRAAVWRLVEKSMRDGTLEQIKDGRLVAAKISSDISDSVESRSDALRKQRDNQDEELDLSGANSSLDFSLDSPSRSPEQVMINVCNGTAEEEAGLEDGLHVHEKERTTPPECIDLVSSAEEGEIEDNTTKSEADDAMMQYSNSDALEKEPPEIEQLDSATLERKPSRVEQLDGAIDGPSKGSILKELSPESLNKQVRYFHVGNSPEDVDIHLPVKCLACGRAGHNSNSCDALRCSNCGDYNNHLTLRCPASPKCTKCRESGHHESSCPYKLKVISSDEVTCDLCQNVGHIEEDCELMWRTSERRWVPDIYSNIRIRLSCYECGIQGHLGNDCPSRRPGKGFGSSSWSMFQKFDVPLRSEQHHIQEASRAKRHTRGTEGNGLKIKGRAHDQPIVIPPETLPDKQSFLHPKKLPEPVRRSTIRINTGPSQRLPEKPQHIPFTPIQQPFGDYASGQQDFRHPSDKGYARETDFARYNHGNPGYDGDYDRPRRRSRSPPQGAGRREYREDRYRPDPPSAERGSRNGSLYRPMPSAARNAYKRRRM